MNQESIFAPVVVPVMDSVMKTPKLASALRDTQELTVPFPTARNHAMSQMADVTMVSVIALQTTVEKTALSRNAQATAFPTDNAMLARIRAIATLAGVVLTVAQGHALES